MKVIEILEESVKSLYLTMRIDGNILGTGTGFIVNSPIGYVLLTNRHNVTGRHNETNELLSTTGGVPNEIVISHNKKNIMGSWVNRIEQLYDLESKPLWKEHPEYGSKADFVALPLTNIDDVEFRAYDLNEQPKFPKPKPSDTISVVGFPFGIQMNGSIAIWATGFVASEPDLPSPRFLIDSRTRPGQSGSPVIAQRNNGGTFVTADGTTQIVTGILTQFLGIYSGRINNESDIGIVWKAEAIKELIDSLITYKKP
jgi:hypothetical protein